MGRLHGVVLINAMTKDGIRTFRRAQPLLGTVVEISVGGIDQEAANQAIDRGFAAIADIHGLMSFHEANSDISRLNREASTSAIVVHPHTFAVLRHAQDFAADTDGLFDITIAPRLVTWGFLPPPNAPTPDLHATWRDIVLDEGRVRFVRPLWIDLGGIAKGYAVDAALKAMDLTANVQCCINAGGDLRVSGPAAESVRLRLPFPADPVPVIAIQDGSLASSSGREHMRESDGKPVGPHVNGQNRAAAPLDVFVSVASPTCIVADALTKVVLACGEKSEPILRKWLSVAYIHDVRGWRTLGEDLGRHE